MNNFGIDRGSRRSPVPISRQSILCVYENVGEVIMSLPFSQIVSQLDLKLSCIVETALGGLRGDGCPISTIGTFVAASLRNFGCAPTGGSSANWGCASMGESSGRALECIRMGELILLFRISVSMTWTFSVGDVGRSRRRQQNNVPVRP